MSRRVSGFNSQPWGSYGPVRESIQALFQSSRQYSFVEGGYLCFEENCDSPVAIRELMDKGLYKAPVNQYYGPGEYEVAIDSSIQLYQPEYWAYRNARLEKEPLEQLSLFPQKKGTDLER